MSLTDGMDFECPFEWVLEKAMRVEGLGTEPADLLYLAKYAAIAPGKQVLEIGSLTGRATLALASSGKRVFTLDIRGWIGFKENTARISTITQFMGDSKKFEWTKGEVGLLFIDGDHAYEMVANDYDRFSPFVPDGGYILFHDWYPKGHFNDEGHWPNVRRFVRDRDIKGFNPGGTHLWVHQKESR